MGMTDSDCYRFFDHGLSVTSDPLYKCSAVLNCSPLIGVGVSTGSRDSMSLDTKTLQRKLSPSRLWRTSPRATRRSLDAMTSLRDGNQATRMRRTTFRRHSSGGEGGHSDDRRPRHMSYEDRRWSIGSEMVDAPYAEGHLLDYFLWGYVKSLVYADKPQTLDPLEDNIRRVIADIRPQMLEKVIESWTSRSDYIRASLGSPMPEIIFKM
ncbi:uncharacterized protein TNCV_184751 [Trichonephila clavipes]|nr:uncharacterized protein TNCV_184751 [Trichonephila clavipes]